MSYITIDDGLGRNFIDDIYRDSKGFVWLSLAGGGLVRYDGHSLLTFAEGSHDHSIPCDFVRNVTEDKFRRLWAATASSLFVIDLDRMRAIALEDISPRLKPLALKEISSVTADSSGNIWIGTEGVIICLTFNAEGLLETYSDLDTKGPHAKIIFREIGNEIWTAFDDRIYSLSPSPESDREGLIDAKPLNITIPPGSSVNQIIEKGEDVWIGTTEGLVRHSIASRHNKLYTCVETDETTLTQSLITDLAIGPDNRLIACTLCGYSIYNALSDDFTRIQQSDAGLNSPFVNCILVDGQNVWIGTESGGVNLLSPKAIDCGFYPTTHPVNAIYADPQGTVWVGCVEGGLSVFNPAEGTLTKAADASNSLPHNSVSAITMDSSGRLWVGTWGGGITLIDTDNPRESLMQIDMLAGMQRRYIGSIVYDYINDGVWIGSNPGIFFYDCKNGRTLSPIPGSEDWAFGPLGAVIDDNGHLWMGCNNGLYDIDLRSRKGDAWDFRCLDRMLNSPGGNIKENVSYLAIGPDGSLWVGSDSHGLYRRSVDATGEHFENFTISTGLAHNAVKGIAFDGKSIWVSTHKGLTSISAYDGSTQSYLKGNGLPDDTFYWNAAASSQDSEVYFGSMSGLISIRPQGKRQAIPGPVIFTSLSVDNTYDVDAYVDADISVADRVRLHESNRSFAVTFSSLDFSSGPASQYLYMLDGFDKDWILLPEGRFDASYTNLAPGHYTLRVKYGAHGKESTLPIDVQPYFYNTSWFITLIALISLSMIWLLWRMRVRRLLRQKTELAMKAEERTREISAQKQRIEEQALQMQQFTVERLSFFTNLTHEFRTPITLVLGPIEHAIKMSDNPKVQDQLHMAFRNAQYLMSLVNQLMDFRKIESGKMEIVRSKGDFRAFVEDMAQNFSNVLQKRNIKVLTYFHLSEPEIYFDREAMRKLLHNFLSNAAKYTPDGGTISIYAADLRQAGENGRPMLYVNVKDTGDGLDPNDLDKVFDKYYQGHTKMKYPSPMGSSGLGLHLCKSIVEAYGGTLKAKNNHGPGCCFRMLLPLIEEPAGAESAKAPESSPSESRLPSMLIVEDNPDMRAFLRGILSERFRVKEASDGIEALEILKTDDIDFIISDLMMPRMDGLAFVRKIREDFETSHIPVLMLTAKTAQSTQIESYRTGVDGFLTKPFGEEMLMARIDAIIANRQLQNRKMMQSFAGDTAADTAAEPHHAEIIEDSPDSRFIKQVIETIEANYKNSYYEVGDFADDLGVSRTVLNKKLQSLLGKAANKLIRDYRLKVALDLIRMHRDEHSMNISEIAYDVGFNDSKYFTRCFTKHYGIPPSAVMQGAEPVSTPE